MTPPLPLASNGRTAVEAARECASIARHLAVSAFGTAGVAKVKGNRDVVTEVDLAIEKAVVRLLSDLFPGHAFLGEESAASTRSNGWMWVLDPIDGTKNFSRGIPHFGFSLALCYDSEPVLGIITHPMLNEEFLAVAGEGMTFQGKRVRLSSVPLSAAVISIDLGFKSDTGASQLALAQRAWPLAQGIRTMGSAALGLAFAASGRWDAYIHASLEPWDLAAGLILVREAGGIVTSHSGEPATIFTRGVVAAVPGVHAEIVELFAPGGGEAGC